MRMDIVNRLSWPNLLTFALHFLVPFALLLPCKAGPTQDANGYAESVAKINTAHARQAGKATETQLAAQLPASAKAALKRVLEAKAAPDLAAALLKCGEAALDLDLMQDFEAVRAKLATVSPAEAAKLGTAVSRPRFIVRGIGEFKAGYLEHFSDVLEAVLGAYD